MLTYVQAIDFSNTSLAGEITPFGGAFQFLRDLQLRRTHLRIPPQLFPGSFFPIYSDMWANGTGGFDCPNLGFQDGGVPARANVDAEAYDWVFCSCRSAILKE